MTRTQAIEKLKSTRTLSTDLIAPLGISFDNFLRLAQVSKDKTDEVITKLIALLESPR